MNEWLAAMASPDELAAYAATRAVEQHLLACAEDENGSNSNSNSSSSSSSECTKVLQGLNLLMVEPSAAAGRRRSLVLIARLLEACCTDGRADAADMATDAAVAHARRVAGECLAIILPDSDADADVDACNSDAAAGWVAVARRVHSFLATQTSEAAGLAGAGAGAGGAPGGSARDGAEAGGSASSAEIKKASSSSENDAGLQDEVIVELCDYLRVVHAASQVASASMDDEAAAAAAVAHGDAHDSEHRCDGAKSATSVQHGAQKLLGMFASEVGLVAPALIRIQFAPVRHSLLAVLREVLLLCNCADASAEVGTLRRMETAILPSACITAAMEPGFLRQLFEEKMPRLERLSLWRGVLLVVLPALNALLTPHTTEDGAGSGSGARAAGSAPGSAADGEEGALPDGKMDASDKALTVMLEAVRVAEDATTGAVSAAGIRSGLFEALAEEDDVMVATMLAALQLEISLFPRDLVPAPKQSSNTSSQDSRTIRTQLIEREKWAILMASNVAKQCIAALRADPLFVQFCTLVAFDHLVLVDLLISNETDFLEYLLTYLRRLGADRRSWTALHEACAEWDLDSMPATASGSPGSAPLAARTIIAVSELLIRLRLALERLANSDLFPYKPDPLIRRLLAVEHFYSNWLGEQ